MNMNRVMRGISEGLERRKAIKALFKGHEGCPLEVTTWHNGPDFSEWTTVPGAEHANALIDQCERKSTGTFAEAITLKFTDEGTEFAFAFRQGRVSWANKATYQDTPALDDGY